MTFNEYQNETAKTALYIGKINEICIEDLIINTESQKINQLLKLCYCGLGLGEAGEIQGKIKKIIRDNRGVLTDDFKASIIGELGDLLWYISEMASTIGCNLDIIASLNIQKLQSRKERGTLQGSGDNR